MAETRQTESKTRTAWIIAKSLAVIGVALSLFQLYTAGLVAMTAMRHRSVFLTCILVMTFLTKPLYKGARKDRFNAALVVDLILVAIAIGIGAYIFIDLQGIFERQGDWSRWDFVVGITLVLLVLEWVAHIQLSERSRLTTASRLRAAKVATRAVVRQQSMSIRLTKPSL